MPEKNLAIIPARGGSKRIPRKNIKDFLGRPVIAYSIEAALASGLFDEVMVSTDDDEIAEIAMRYGAQVPFRRSAASATDLAGTGEVLTEVLRAYAARQRVYTYACCIYPAAPLLSVASLRSAYALLSTAQVDNAFPVCRFGNPIRRALTLDAQGKVGMEWPENETVRSQDLPPNYYDAGQFYWFDAQKFLVAPNILTGNSGAIVIDELHVQDIDTITDWKLAEFKYQLIHQTR
jgi:pseudaminic acid cytidylyltransferase